MAIIAIEEDTYETIEDIIDEADALVTAVINGQSGQMSAALKLARALDDFRRAEQPSKTQH